MLASCIILVTGEGILSDIRRIIVSGPYTEDVEDAHLLSCQKYDFEEVLNL